MKTAELPISIPWYDLTRWIQRRVEERRFKDKTLRFHLKNGRILQGLFQRYSSEHRTFFVIGEGGSSQGIPENSILFLEVAQASGMAIPKEYTFGGLQHALAHLPRPFVRDDGALDLLLVYGEGSRDYADYRQFLKQKGDHELPATRVGRRGDFEYFATLTLALGFYAAKANPSSEPPPIPLAKQGFQVEGNDLERNLIIVGSGAVNTLAMKIFEIYGPDLPVRFGKPDSDEMIIDQVTDEPRIFHRRNDKECSVGLIELLPNPFSPSKVVLVAAGLTVAGTQAALLALSDAVTRKTLRDRYMKIDGGVMAVPAQLVRGRDARYVNGLETIHGYDII